MPRTCLAVRGHLYTGQFGYNLDGDPNSGVEEAEILHLPVLEQNRHYNLVALPSLIEGLGEPRAQTLKRVFG